jgi:molybdopterin converting factor small subunit
MAPKEAADVDAGQLARERKQPRGIGPEEDRDLKVIFFGKLRDSLGEQHELADRHGETIAQLRRRLAELNPSASVDLLSPGVRACVDDEIVAEDFVVGGQQSVEFFPPLSGG